jgi:flagellar basal body-associated protein FliL
VATAVGQPQPSKLPLLLGILNIVVALGAVGFLFYSKVIFKRPQITETGERKRLVKERDRPVQDSSSTAAVITFDPILVNIESTPGQPRPADGTARQIQGKLHYVTVGFGLEIRDEARKEEINILKPVIIDKLISLLGRKPFHELTTVQGRYLLREQILDITNQLTSKKSRDPLVANVFFTHFVVQ